MHFLEWKFLYFDENVTEIFSPGFNQYYSSIDSDNGLVLARQQAIIWTNDGITPPQWVNSSLFRQIAGITALLLWGSGMQFFLLWTAPIGSSMLVGTFPIPWAYILDGFPLLKWPSDNRDNTQRSPSGLHFTKLSTQRKLCLHQWKLCLHQFPKEHVRSDW